MTALPFTVIETAGMAFLLGFRSAMAAVLRRVSSRQLPRRRVPGEIGRFANDPIGTGARGQGGVPLRAGRSPLVAAAAPPATAAANFVEKVIGDLLRGAAISRWPSWASLPPICASTL